MLQWMAPTLIPARQSNRKLTVEPLVRRLERSRKRLGVLTRRAEGANVFLTFHCRCFRVSAASNLMNKTAGEKNMNLLRRFYLSILVVLSVSTHAGGVTTVLALGDSITEGGKNFTSYREILIPELRGKGIKFEFIGPKKDAASAHAGYSGKNTAFLRSISKRVYTEYPADIVMIHAGHNCFSKDKPVAGILVDTEAIINVIREINPEVKILLAQVIPAGKLPKYSYIPQLNQGLASLADRLASQGVDLCLVNQADGFDWRTDAIADKVHPNAVGARKMSEKWMAALLPALGHTKVAAYETVPLWEGLKTGVQADIQLEKALPDGRVSHVTVPTLDVYHPNKPNGVTLLICSGGGYKKLASGPLGLGAADEFLKDGYTVCSLKYRLSPPSVDVVKDACMDGARALRLIRSRAEAWGINPERIGMIGFSAGANLALNLACMNETGAPEATDPLEKFSARPDFIALAALWPHKQTKLSDWTLHTELPPTMIFHARNDRTAPIESAEAIAKALQAKSVPVQLEFYDEGGHMAFNLPSPSAVDWPQRFRTWLHRKELK